jgi:hypothetical protein
MLRLGKDPLEAGKKQDRHFMPINYKKFIEIMVFYSLTYDVNRLCLIYKRKKNMHNLPIEFGAAALLVWGVLQSLSVLLTHLDTASKQSNLLSEVFRLSNGIRSDGQGCCVNFFCHRDVRLIRRAQNGKTR